jgi:hypothetical protein
MSSRDKAKMTTDRRPNAFENAGNSGWHAAELSTNAVPAQYASMLVIWRSLAIVGKATEREAASRAATRFATRIPAKPNNGLSMVYVE